MNSERITLCLLVLVAILAAIPQIPFTSWGVILVVLGLIAGAIGNFSAATDRIVIYVAAIAIPVFSDSLDLIPTIGSWVNQVLDHMATGIQGIAVAIFVIAIYGRLMPGSK